MLTGENMIFTRAASSNMQPFSVASVPLPFFGLAIWRAWMNVTFVAPNADIPFFSHASHELFDMVMLGVFLAGIALAKRWSPLTTKRWALVACPALMTPLSVTACASLFIPEASMLATPLTIPAAIGATFMVLLWSERYAGLPPYKVLVGLTGSYALAAVIVFLLNGFHPPYLAGFTALLPAASIACLVRSKSEGYHVEGLLHTGRGTIPWRLIAVMVLYSFSIGFSGIQASATGGTGSALTAFIVAGTYFAALAFMAERISFASMQKLPPLLMALGFLATPLSPFLGQWISGPLIAASYLLYYFFVDTSLCDVSKRFGISAIWLFSIEEAASMGSELAGRTLAPLLAIKPLGAGGEVSPLSIALLAIAAIAAAILLLDGRSLKTHWGIRFMEVGALSTDSERVVRVGEWVRTAAIDHGLTPRETEVLALLAEGTSMRGIAQELVVSEGTAKSHASHIYEKLGMRGKRDLEARVAEAVGAGEKRRG